MGSYIVWNAPAPTTAAIAKVTTGTAIKTLLQIKPATNSPIIIQEWGISFDGFAAAAPGTVELIDTGTVFATVTAHVAAGIMRYNDPNAPVNTAGTSGIPLNLGTAATGYTATAEGSITTTKVFDGGLIAPTTQYVKQFPLGREPMILPVNCLRIRVTFAAAINALCYVVLAQV
jgi:hypothetical protein